MQSIHQRNSIILTDVFILVFKAEDIPTQQAKRPKQEESPMEVDEVISDPEFLQSVLENLPGVDPQSETIRDAVGSLNKDKKPPSGDKSEKWFHTAAYRDSNSKKNRADADTPLTLYLCVHDFVFFLWIFMK